MTKRLYSIPYFFCGLDSLSLFHWPCSFIKASLIFQDISHYQITALILQVELI